jgi:hypothetical protein
MHSQYLMRASVLDRRPAKSGAVVARSGDTGKDALADHSPVELGEYAHHLKQARPDGADVSRPCWCRNRSTLLAWSSRKKSTAPAGVHGPSRDYVDFPSRHRTILAAITVLAPTRVGGRTLPLAVTPGDVGREWGTSWFDGGFA